MDDDSAELPVVPGETRVEALIDSGALDALFRPRVETQLELPQAEFRLLTEEAAVRVDPRVDWPAFVEELWLAVDGGFNLTRDPRWDDFDETADRFAEVLDELLDEAIEQAEQRRGGDHPSGGLASVPVGLVGCLGGAPPGDAQVLGARHGSASTAPL